MPVEDASFIVNLLNDKCASFWGQLSDFCSLIGLTRDYSDQVRLGKMMLDAFSQMVSAQQARTIQS